MKVSKEQLRRIIREAVNRKLDEATPERDPGGQTIGRELAEAVSSVLHVHADEVFKRTMALTDDSTDRPVRYEDIEGFAQKATELALSEFSIYEVLENVAIKVLSELMEAE
jgi:hypothetical protein